MNIPLTYFKKLTKNLKRLMEIFITICELLLQFFAQLDQIFRRPPSKRWNIYWLFCTADKKFIEIYCRWKIYQDICSNQFFIIRIFANSHNTDSINHNFNKPMNLWIAHTRNYNKSNTKHKIQIHIKQVIYCLFY